MADGRPPTPRNPLALIEGLLTPMRRLMGDEAGTSLFHYAAVQEGRRLAGDTRRSDLPRLLARLDEMLDQHTEMEETGPHTVRLHVHGPHPTGTTDATLTVLLGLFEGALGATYGRPAVGRLLGSADDRLDIEIEMEGAGGLG